MRPRMIADGVTRAPYRQVAAWVFGMALVAGLGGCGDDDAPSTDSGVISDSGAVDGGSDAGTGGTSLSGTVTLDSDLFPPLRENVSGTLLIAVIDPAQLVGGGAPVPVAMAAIPTEVTTAGWEVTYLIDDAPVGRWAVVGLFDKDSDLDFEAGPGPGDLLSNYLPFEVVAGENTLDIALVAAEIAPEYCGQAPLDVTERTCVFDFVWGYANRNYSFFEEKSIDWNAVRDRYRPMAEAATDDAAFHLVIHRMVVELRDYHSHYLDTSLLETLGHCPPLDVQLVDGALYIVDPGVEGTRLGVAAGDRVTFVDGESITNRLDAWANDLYSAHHRAHFERVVGPILLCEGPGTSSLEVRHTGGTIGVDIDRSRGPGELIRRIFDTQEGVLADVDLLVHHPINIDSTRRAGLIRIKTFTQGSPNMERALVLFDEALAAYADADAMILDVRGNGGGSLPLVHDMVARFLSSETVLYNQVYQSGDPVEPVMVAPAGAHPYAGPVVVLIDEGSYSAATLFPSIMQSIGRATLIGRATGGGSSPVSLQDFALTDTTLINMSSNYYLDTGDGVITETEGARPDIVVPLTLADVIDGRAFDYGSESDPGLNAALSYLRSL